MQTFSAVRVAELDVGEGGRGWPLSGERWVIHHPGTREVVVLDRQFEPVWRMGLPSAWGNVCAVAEDLSLVACSLGPEVRLLDGAGAQVARFHLAFRETPRWDANCVFARDGRHLWAHAFTDGRDELWLIDLTELEIVDHRRLDTWAVGFTPFHHPDGQTIGLELPEGQDGCAIRVIARLPAAVALPVADEWGASQKEWCYCAGYLTDEVILAGVQSDADEWHALVKRSPMSVLGRVDYGPTVWPGWFEPPRAGTWVTTFGRMIQRWELAEDPSERFGTQLSLLDET